MITIIMIILISIVPRRIINHIRKRIRIIVVGIRMLILGP